MSTTEFVASVKVGDCVAVRDRSVGLKRHQYGYRVLTVTKITPSRAKFTLVDSGGKELVMNKYGQYSTGSGHWGYSFNMEPVTPGILQQIRRDNLVIKFGTTLYKVVDSLRTRDLDKDSDAQLEDLMGAMELLLRI